MENNAEKDGNIKLILILCTINGALKSRNVFFYFINKWETNGRLSLSVCQGELTMQWKIIFIQLLEGCLQG